MANTKGYAIRQKIIDRCLQSERGYSIQEIMDKCNLELEERGLHTVTSKNTIRDDILEIQNTYFIDIETIRIGKNKRYRYKERDFSIYNAPLTEKDIANLQEILSTLNLFQGKQQFKWIEETNLRIQSSMSCHLRQDCPIVEFDENPFLKGLNFLPHLFDAIHLHHALDLEYKRFNSTTVLHYIVHPYYLKQYNNRWFVLAQTNEYSTLSIFALDRICSITEAAVPYVHNTKINFKEYFKDIIGVSKPKGASVENIRLWIDKELLPYIDTKPIHHSQTILEQDDNGATVQITVIPNFELEQMLLSYGESLKVISPLSLENKIRERIRKSLNNYDKFR